MVLFLFYPSLALKTKKAESSFCDSARIIPYNSDIKTDMQPSQSKLGFYRRYQR